MKIVKKAMKMAKKIYKSSKLTKILIFLSLILIIMFVVKKDKNEGFAQKKSFMLKKNDTLYDDFYCDIYNDLVYDPKKNKFELDNIMILEKDNMKTLLDVGSGHGHHVKEFGKMGIKTKGIDKSKAMIKRAKKTYPGLDFINGDVLNSIQFMPGSFSHITCFYFTIYYIQDKGLFFKNCYDWLKPGGKLIVHLVNRDKFDPILNASDPLIVVSAQKYAKKRITNSTVKFKDFQYKANFNMDKQNNQAEFVETMKDDATGNVRKNIHTFYMDTQKNILSLAKQVGFILEGKIDMVSCQYAYQYLYILKKPF